MAGFADHGTRGTCRYARIGEQVASGWLTVADGAAPAGEGLSAAVDEAGVRGETEVVLP